jgi:SAM-dependent methyltransferase
MEREAFDEMRRVQAWHWWFVARRRILASQIAALELPEKARILEVGCGPGGNLGMLSRFGEVTGLEPDPQARRYAARTAGVPVTAGALPLPETPAEQFDMVAALDVLEHIGDDAGAADGLRELTRPGGYVVATVPAYGWMWSGHDELHHHQRRYSRRAFGRLLEGAGLRIRRLTHFNTVLFPVIAGVRLATRGTSGAADTAPGRPVNRLLTEVFAAERHALRLGDLPFGVSLLAIAERP